MIWSILNNVSPSNFNFRPRIKLHIYLKTGSLWFECHCSQTVALQKQNKTQNPEVRCWFFLNNSCKHRKSNCPQDPRSGSAYPMIPWMFFRFIISRSKKVQHPSATPCSSVSHAGPTAEPRGLSRGHQSMPVWGPKGHPWAVAGDLGICDRHRMWFWLLVIFRLQWNISG